MARPVAVESAVLAVAVGGAGRCDGVGAACGATPGCLACVAIAVAVAVVTEATDVGGIAPSAAAVVWAAATAPGVAAGPVGAAARRLDVPAHAVRTLATANPATNPRRGTQD
ncbi:MAG: hypothetical protein QOF30_2284 [Acidimicrobiaceae bacterium]|nr:hypothetical protein [Acidimicrobiaceae bacterium]